MKRFLPAFEDILFVPSGAQVLVYFRLRGLGAPLGLSRLSDGTLRFLSLLAGPHAPVRVAQEVLAGRTLAQGRDRRLAVTRVRVYVEGGGDTRDQQTRQKTAMRTWIAAAVEACQ
jgi:hypothetical protein